MVFATIQATYDRLQLEATGNTSLSCLAGSQRETKNLFAAVRRRRAVMYQRFLQKNAHCIPTMICYNNLTMTHPTPIDISNLPDLVRIAEEVEATKTPRELVRDNKPVALLTPIYGSKAKWEKIKATFGSWNDLDADELIATLSRWRKEGSRPATRPQ